LRCVSLRSAAATLVAFRSGVDMQSRRKPALGGIVAQLFHPYADTAARIVLFALAASPALLIGAGFAITRSPYNIRRDPHFVG
jgi:hypothetical protein